MLPQVTGPGHVEVSNAADQLIVATTVVKFNILTLVFTFKYQVLMLKAIILYFLTTIVATNEAFQTFEALATV